MKMEEDPGFTPETTDNVQKLKTPNSYILHNVTTHCQVVRVSKLTGTANLKHLILASPLMDKGK
jgi:hypothetical protein